MNDINLSYLKKFASISEEYVLLVNNNASNECFDGLHQKLHNELQSLKNCIEEIDAEIIECGINLQRKILLMASSEYRSYFEMLKNPSTYDNFDLILN